MYPKALLRISKKHDGILGNGRQRRGHGGMMPVAQAGGRIEFLHQAGLTGYCIQQAHIATKWSRAFEDSTRNSPNCTPKCPGALQILSAYPHVRKPNRTECQPALKLSRTRQPFELASVAHIARVSEVEAQPPKKDKIFGDSHPTLSIYSN